MRLSKTLFPFVIVLSQLLSHANAASDNGTNEAYLVQPGDILEISVWNEENLIREVVVRPDGGISFPLVGNANAAGKSIDELQNLIAGKLAKYIPDPVVTVATKQLSGNKIYVIGKVNRPGEFIANRNMDIVQALSLAGGMTPYAATNKILVLRRVNGVLSSIPFRYGDIEKGKHLQQNIILQSGDVVLIP